MRLDHLLSKENRGIEKDLCKFLGQSLMSGVRHTLFNLEGTRGVSGEDGPIAQLARAHD